MSLSLANTWVTTTIRSPHARAQALELLRRVKGASAVGTLIVGAKLSATKKCFLARWDGTELLVMELTGAQQRDWSIGPTALYQELKSTTLPASTMASEALLSLHVEHVDSAGNYDGRTELSGTCVAEPASWSLIPNCALRADYFRPGSSGASTAMWYCDQSLFSGPAQLHFRFPPLFFRDGPQIYRGTVAVFLQLFAADDWKKELGCRAISNVAQTMIQLK